MTTEPRGYSTGRGRRRHSQKIYGLEICDPGTEFKMELTPKKKGTRLVGPAKIQKQAQVQEILSHFKYIKNVREEELGNFRNSLKGTYNTSAKAKFKVDKKK